MFAVLKTGGKQYKVANGDILRIEKVTGNAGEKVQFNEILMVGGDNLVVGAPNVAGAAVQAEILEQGKGPKVINYVKRRRKHSSQRRKGHRQPNYSSTCNRYSGKRRREIWSIYC